MAGQSGSNLKPFAGLNDRRSHGRYSPYVAFALLLMLISAALMVLVQNKPARELTTTAFSPTPAVSPSPTLLASPTVTQPTPSPEAEPSATPPSAEVFSMVASVDLARLIIPVAGVRGGELHDTFSEARAEGRVHNALDIIAPHETPVLAAASGEVVKLFDSERGGHTIYQKSADTKYIFYYAHLDHYAEGLAQGHYAQQGEVIGYVGDTGNAGAGNYHLHFAIWLITDPKHYWDGININPYPLLRRALGDVPHSPSLETKKQEE